jgi:hypothetical protein
MAKHAKTDHRKKFEKMQLWVERKIEEDSMAFTYYQLDKSFLLSRVCNSRGAVLYYPNKYKESDDTQVYPISDSFLKVLRQLKIREPQSRSPFESLADEEDDEKAENLVVRIENTKKFDAIVACVATSASFNALRTIWNTVAGAGFGKLSEKELNRTVPKIGILSLLLIRSIMTKMIGFSIALDAADLNSGGLVYCKHMGIRFRIFHDGGVVQFYVAQLPILKSLTEIDSEEEDSEDESIDTKDNKPMEKCRDRLLRILLSNLPLQMPW